MDYQTFDHCGFVTTDMDATLRFWTTVIGLEQPQPVVERSGDWVAEMTGVPRARLRIAHLYGDGVHLEFLEFTGGSSGNPALPAGNDRCTGHVCLRVTDVVATCQRLQAAGAALQGRITTITEGGATGLQGVYIRDPNGLLVELLQIAA